MADTFKIQTAKLSKVSETFSFSIGKGFKFLQSLPFPEESL